VHFAQPWRRFDGLGLGDRAPAPVIQRPGTDRVPVDVQDGPAFGAAAPSFPGDMPKDPVHLAMELLRVPGLTESRVARFEIDMERHHFTPTALMYGIRNRSQRNCKQAHPSTMQAPWPAENTPLLECWEPAPSPVWPQAQTDAGAPSLYSLDASRCSSVILGMARFPFLP